jgi:uncharacterized protein GlcG (DUF336 family)
LVQNAEQNGKEIDMKYTHEFPSINEEGAQLLIRSAVDQARKMGFGISVCVVDPAGRTKAFLAMDQAPQVSYETAAKKARTAVGFGLPTGKTWHDFIKDDPILAQGAQHLPDFILLGGGSPILVEGKLIGAVGVSGGHYAQDEECVKAALEAFAKE